uniref:Uncharacterized protein n=1 Tax=Triticum urartu TaxID=4572 RepID=A0A8R7UTS5_TRIUA
MLNVVHATVYESSVRADYQALFNAVGGVTKCLNQQQKNQFDVWMLHAVVANDLCTDDSFLVSLTTNLCRSGSNVVEVAATLTEDQKKPGYMHQVLVDVATKFWFMCICFLIVCT